VTVKVSAPCNTDIGLQNRKGELERRGRLDFENHLADLEQSFVETAAKPRRQFDDLFVAQQSHYVSQAVVHSPAVITAFEVLLNPTPELRLEIAFQIVGQLLSDLIAIDFYDTRFAGHEYHRSIGCRNAKKVTLAIIFVHQPTLETFATLLNPTAT
jgi:hypothetical protein